jgi:cytochrome c oxidase cbb3-type subunit I
MQVPETTGHHRTAIALTPFHAAALLFLVVGLAFAVYQGLDHLGLAPRVAWIGWSHIHFVTVGAFTQLVFGMLPQLAARKLSVPSPSRAWIWSSFAALNGGFLTAWIGRAFGSPVAYDLGLGTVWLTTLALIGLLVAMAGRSEGRWKQDPTVWLYIASPLALLTGLTFAFALYASTLTFEVPAGWWGLREGHVHANAWGFLGLAAIGTLNDLFPRIVASTIHSRRMQRWSAIFLLVGIGPLVFGPILGLGRTVTGTGLLLFGVGYGIYVWNLVATYRRGRRSGLALSVLVAQAWILGPAGFAPFVLFDVPLGIPEPWIETGALHFFFVGWALPVALAGMALFLSNLPSVVRAGPMPSDPDGLLPYDSVPGSIVRGWMIAAWNVAVVVVAFSFFYRNAPWAPAGLGIASGVLALLWGHHLVRIVQQRLTVLARTA